MARFNDYLDSENVARRDEEDLAAKRAVGEAIARGMGFSPEDEVVEGEPDFEQKVQDGISVADAIKAYIRRDRV